MIAKITKITKFVLFAVLAACGVQSCSAAAPDEPPKEKEPPDDDQMDQMDQHFCCQSVDPKTFSGEGCSLITEQQVALCNKILYCEGNWVKDGDKVTCE